MSKLDRAGTKATGETLFPDNTNEEITPERQRAMVDNYADSMMFLDDVNTVTGDTTFSVNVNVPLTPTADPHAVSLKYFNDNASPSSGDVTGDTSSVDNTIVVWDGVTGKAIKNGTGVVLSQTSDFSQVGNIGFATATKTIAGIEVGNLLDKSISQTVSGGWTVSGDWTVSGVMNHTAAVFGIAPTVDLHLATKKYVDDNAGVGDVVGAASSVDGGLALYDSTTGKLLKSDPNINWTGTQLNVGGTLSINDLTVDNIVIDGNEISSSSGGINFSPVSATDALVLESSSGNATFTGNVTVEGTTTFQTQTTHNANLRFSSGNGIISTGSAATVQISGSNSFITGVT